MNNDTLQTNLLKNKKVLFIAPSYYHYHLSIIDKLKSFGAEITYFPEAINNKLFTNMRVRITSPFNTVLDRAYFKFILSRVQENQYDMVFLIRGGIVESHFLEKLRSKLKNAKFIMYQWDSLVHNDYLTKIKFFDKVLTFDKKDALKCNIDYLPLFYTEEYEEIANTKKEIKYDIVFFGAYHSDRLEIIKKIDLFCKKNNLNFKHHLYIAKVSKFKLWLNKKIPNEDLIFLKTYKVGISDMVDAYSKARSVLDIEMTNQTGLTIRTIEALGSNTKLITTNKEILKNDFYDEDYIYILNKDKIEVDIGFLKNSVDKHEKFSELHIDNWLKNIIN